MGKMPNTKNQQLSLSGLVIREIRYRFWSFLLATFAVAAAAAMLFGSEGLLRLEQRRTVKYLNQREEETEHFIQAHERLVAAAGANLQDTVRKQMLTLGFNILILPKDVDLAALYMDGSINATMPYSYAEKLANSNIVTVNHLLPSVTKSVRWPEHELDVMVNGTQGEIPIMHRGLKAPILDAVAPGQMVVGATIQQKLKLELGKPVTLLGRQFNICKIQPERGSIDDMSLWIELGAAQEMLGMQNLIHAILALECECAGDRISEIRREIAEILPGTQVIERYSQALTRAEARMESKRAAEESLALAKTAGQATLEREREQRLDLLHQQQVLNDTLGPIVIVLTCFMVAALAFHNFRQRKSEIGLMRALGLGSTSILGIFLSKAVLVGALGGFIGVAIASTMIADRILRAEDSTSMLEIWNAASLTATAVWIPILMIGLTVVASWLAAFQAIRQDAAIVLQGE